MGDADHNIYYLYFVDEPDLGDGFQASLVAKLAGISDRVATEYAQNIVCRSARSYPVSLPAQKEEIPDSINELAGQYPKGKNDIVLAMAETDILYTGPQWWVLCRRKIPTG